MLMTFQAALLLARYTNRTFIVPAARNDRYNDFRFSWAVDYEALRPVWPCFMDSDTPWGEGPAPDADGDEVTRALLAKGKGGRKIPTSEVESDYKPKPGTLAATRPHRASMKNGQGKMGPYVTGATYAAFHPSHHPISTHDTRRGAPYLYTVSPPCD